MDDLTDVLLQAKSNATPWSEEKLLSTASRIQQACGGRLDWDRGAGEDWACILADVAIAILRVDFPLVIALAYKSHRIWDDLQRDGLSVFQASGFHNPEYRIDPAKVASIFSRERWDVLDTERLSIADLWWATIF